MTVRPHLQPGEGAGLSAPSSASAQALLAARRLSKYYGAVRALRDVSFTLASGEVLGVAGENGAGKSTLVRIVAGLERPDEGSVLLDGTPLAATPASHQARGVRIVPQELMLCSELSVAENVALGGLTSRHGVIRWRAVLDEARERLARLGLGDIDVRQPVGRLPLVERALVQIARAIVPGTKVLIVDEPTAPMSANEVERVLGVLENIARSGVAIMYISHRLQELFRLCGRAVVLRDGALAAELRGAELTHDALVSAMLGSREMDRRQRAPSAARPTVVMRADEVRGGAVASATLEIRAGEVVGVYGVLGSGRDDLGALLAGARARDGGAVTVDGQKLPNGSVHGAIARGVGFVPAERRAQGLALELSIRDNLTLGMLGSVSRRGVLDRRREDQVVDDWMQRLRVAAPGRSTPIGRLSGGSQQKVLIARWMAAGVRILVLEEPTRGVDVATKADIYRLLRERAASEGTAVLALSSDVEEVVALSDRILVMAHGRIAAEMTDPDQEDVVQAALRGGTRSKDAR